MGSYQYFFSEGTTGLKNPVQRELWVHEQFLFVTHELKIVNSKTVFHQCLNLLCLGAVIKLVPSCVDFPIGNTVMKNLKQPSFCPCHWSNS